MAVTSWGCDARKARPPVREQGEEYSKTESPEVDFVAIRRTSYFGREVGGWAECCSGVVSGADCLAEVAEDSGGRGEGLDEDVAFSDVPVHVAACVEFLEAEEEVLQEGCYEGEVGSRPILVGEVAVGGEREDHVEVFWGLTASGFIAVLAKCLNE